MHQIKQYREKAGLTQKELGLLVGGLRQSAIGNYENEPRNPSIEIGRAIVRALNERGVNCSFDDVFPDDLSNTAS